MAAWVRDSLVPCECFVSAQSRVSVRAWRCAPARPFVSHLNEEALQDTNGDEDDEATDEEEAGAEDQLHVQTEQHHRLATEPAAEGTIQLRLLVSGSPCSLPCYQISNYVELCKSILLITLCPSVCPSVRVSWFKNDNNSTTAGTRRTKFGTQVGWPGPVIVLKFQHTATDGAPSARARVRH